MVKFYFTKYSEKGEDSLRFKPIYEHLHEKDFENSTFLTYNIPKKSGMLQGRSMDSNGAGEALVAWEGLDGIRAEGRGVKLRRTRWSCSSEELKTGPLEAPPTPAMAAASVVE